MDECLLPSVENTLDPLRRRSPMSSFLLAAVVVCLPAAEDDKLIERLNRDFAELLETEKDPRTLRDAARVLEETNQSDRWTNYSTAVAMLRRSRAKAAVPLLLKYMLVHSSFSTSHVVIPAYAEALAILTGKDPAEGQRNASGFRQLKREAVEEFVRSWWLPNREKVTTDPGRMSEEQLQVVVERLLAQVAYSAHLRQRGRTKGALEIEGLLSVSLGTDRLNRPVWWKEELHPAMVPFLLAAAGYVDPVSKKVAFRFPPANGELIRYSAVPMLAALRENGEAPGLERIAEDAKQSSATRLMSLLALYSAGESLKTKSLSALLGKEENPESRVAVTLALRYTRDHEVASLELLKLLDDQDDQIRIGAVMALGRCAQKAALPKLKKILEEGRPTQAVPHALRTVAAIGTQEAQEVLARFLEERLQDGDRAKNLYQALDAFQEATGKRWIEAGAHPQEYYRTQAAVALEWWKRKKE
jgi:HEAT repeat protein